MGTIQRWKVSLIMNVNLTQFKKFYPILIAAGLLFSIIILFGLILLFSGRQKTDLKPSPTAFPTPSPTKRSELLPPKIEQEKIPPNVREIRAKIIASQIETRGGDVMLFKSSAYEIVYLPTLDVFYVLISQDPAETHKKQAQNWFISFGLKQADLCDLPVRFTLRTITLKKSNPNFSGFPDGC